MVAFGRAAGVRRPAGKPEVGEQAGILQPRYARSLLPIIGELQRERSGQGLRPALVRRQDGLGRRRSATANRVHDPRPKVDEAEGIGTGVLGVLESECQCPVEQVAEPAVDTNIDTLGVAEVGVGQQPDDVGGTSEGILQRHQTTRRVGQVVLVVRRDVEHHVLAERVANTELEGDGTTEV